MEGKEVWKEGGKDIGREREDDEDEGVEVIVIVVMENL